MKPKHTPGPWTIDRNSESCLGIISKSARAMVAELDVNFPVGESTEANASLISAAPEMLECLERLFVHARIRISTNTPRSKHK